MSQRIVLVQDDWSAAKAVIDAHGLRRDGFEFFRSPMRWKAIDRQLLESSLHHAIERRELALEYQPKLILETGEIIGAEAILRWRHPERGLVPPGQFIAIAEGCGLIVAIGRWVLREACCQMRAWQLEGLGPRCISIKISALELRASGFVAGVRAVLAETDLEPRYLELEMPCTLQMGDTRLMQDSRSLGNVIEELRELGALSALVDFETAYSSSNDSKGFPIDTLKIDQSLMSGRARSEDGIDILGGLIGAGNCPHVRVVAKGAETRDQIEILIQPNRPEGGGYDFSWPVPAKEFGRLLKHSAGLTHWSDQIALSGEATEASIKHRLM